MPIIGPYTIKNGKEFKDEKGQDQNASTDKETKAPVAEAQPAPASTETGLKAVVSSIFQKIRRV